MHLMRSKSLHALQVSVSGFLLADGGNFAFFMSSTLRTGILFKSSSNFGLDLASKKTEKKKFSPTCHS
jgi:hypothetical protein